MSQPMRLGLLACLLAMATLQGCAIDREGASVSPDADLSRLKRFYVVKFAPDGRGIQDVIAAELRKRGLEASAGEADAAPGNVDAIVTYQDRWRWDMAMYMIELRVYVREPQTERLLASGTSFHTSLSRRTPEEMAAEVLSNILKGSKK